MSKGWVIIMDGNGWWRMVRDNDNDGGWWGMMGDDEGWWGMLSDSNNNGPSKGLYCFCAHFCMIITDTDI